MRKYLLIIFVLATGFAACHSDNSSASFNADKQAVKDDSTIQTYIKKNHITAVKDPSGLYYQVLKQGPGPNATESSTVRVTYEGKMIDGTVFDKTVTPAIFPLKNVVPGWTIGIPHVKAGGSILLIIPSKLGYGNAEAGPIPENSVLIFTIDVLNVQ